MSSSFPKYTGGGIGPASRPLLHSHINRITDAVAKVEAAVSGKPSDVADVRRTFFAKLTATASTVGTYTTWDWEQVGVVAAGNDVDHVSTLMRSADFETGKGRAVEVGSGASADDIVLMHELPGFDGVRRFAFGAATGGTAAVGRMEMTWAVINATQSGGTITTGVAPTDLTDGIYEYKAVPVKITAYSAGAFTYSVDDDSRFEPTVYGGTNCTLLNPPTHQNDTDWKYAGVVTSAGSGYPSTYDIRGIGEERDTGGGASTWRSVLVQICRYEIATDSYLWLLMAEPDHDGSCESVAAADSFAPGFFGGS